MTTTCPACNKAVDPLRSRFVGVLGGKVVAYCSAECAGAPASPTVARATLPIAVVPPPVAAPAPALVLVPAPALASATAPQTTAASVPARPAALVGPPRPETPVSGVPVNIDSGPVIEIVREPASDVVASVASVASVVDEPGEPRAKHPDEIAIGAFWSADKQKTAAVGSGPAAFAATERIRPVGGRDDTLDKWAIDERSESREGGRPLSIDETRERSGAARALSEAGGTVQMRRNRRMPVMIVVLALLGAGGLLLYRYVTRSKAAAADRPSAVLVPAVPPPVAPVPASEPATAAAPAAVDPVAALAQARATLTTNLAAASPRVQRIAAAALARSSDPAARDVLASQLGLGLGVRAELQARSARPEAARARDIETSDIARLDLAYSLARAGDRRGSDVLAQALISPRAEARDEAARLLALLGDPRAVPRLTDVLAVSQRRLGAAEHLAHLAEPRAIKVLQQLRGDARASADDKARATIALGIARHADVAPALRDMLADPHFNAFAGAALAELKDAAARPVLERQLDSPALRVRSARALRRLDPAIDPRPLLPHLLDVLASGRDTDQVQAAEAIMLLVGPAAWSAYQ